MDTPFLRMRRLRQTPALRSLVRETTLAPSQLVYPLFLCPGEGVRREIGSMPGVFNLSLDEAEREAEIAAKLGLGGLLLFGLPESKDEEGSGAWAEDGIVQRGLRRLKANSALRSLVLIADVCLCEYTTHGHCGVLHAVDGEMHVHNDRTLLPLARTAVSLAKAGADVIAPSDMMDGRVAAIRRALDASDASRHPSSVTRQSLPPLSTDHSARRLIRPPGSATGAPTRWTAPTCSRPCARLKATSPKART